MYAMKLRAQELLEEQGKEAGFCGGVMLLSRSMRMAAWIPTRFLPLSPSLSLASIT